MKSNNIDLLEKAKNYAFLLLKFRLRSEKEIYDRLKRKKFNEEIIKKIISFLKEKDFVNDNDFAQMWIAARIKKPLGLRRIREELRLKGIDKKIVDNQIEKIKEGYSEEDIIFKIAKIRFNKLQGIEPDKAKRRLFSYLLQRGFSPNTITDVISQL